MNGSDATVAADARTAVQQQLRDVTASLIAEYAGRLPAHTVAWAVSRCREELMRSGVRAGLAFAVESSARLRLSALLPAHGSGA